VYWSPSQLVFMWLGVHDAVMTTLSGVDLLQVENDDGDTVMDIMSGLLDVATRVTGETVGLHVKESGTLPENPSDVLNLIWIGFMLQTTGAEAFFAYAE